MFINYCEHDLIELFGEEPKIAATKEAGIFIYSKENQNGISITFSFSVYENNCDLSLSINNNLLFKTSLQDVGYLRKEDRCLRIHQSKSGVDYLIFFYPNLFIMTESTI